LVREFIITKLAEHSHFLSSLFIFINGLVFQDGR
jgi:hypothetical protein